MSEDDLEELIKGCASLDQFKDVLSEYVKLRNLLETYNGDPNQLKEILDQTLYVSNLYNDIRNARREEFKKRPSKDLPSANYQCSNIIFKLLSQYGLEDLSDTIIDFLDSRLKN